VIKNKFFGLGSVFFGIVENILGGQFFILFQFTVNGEFRADDLAEVAVHAFPLLGHQGGMVAFPIEFWGFLEYLVRAKLDAEPAALAAILDDEQLTDGDRMVFGIQR
jgi:hypothetical protein